MAKKFIKLVGCTRYTYKGRSYEAKVVNEVEDDEVAEYLLSQKNEYGLSYFKEVTKLGPSSPQAKAKAKAAAEAKARKEEEDTFEEVEEDDPHAGDVISV